MRVRIVGAATPGREPPAMFIGADPGYRSRAASRLLKSSKEYRMAFSKQEAATLSA
jgi:hypothetical protein